MSTLGSAINTILKHMEDNRDKGSWWYRLYQEAGGVVNLIRTRSRVPNFIFEVWGGEIVQLVRNDLEQGDYKLRGRYHARLNDEF